MEVPDRILNRYPTIQMGTVNNEKEMIEFHTLCDVFLMPSLDESFGMMAVEAMSAETVVICFEDTVVAENVGAPEIGISVSYGDSDQLAKAIDSMYCNSGERKRRGSDARLIVRKKFRYEEYVDKHIELYRNIIARQGSNGNKREVY
ncbi:glycosyltransferase [Hungatella hathewayi]|uniref:glycosyltransferase n=1 Tax=Hungatella hathewayi TaxID=154046 RepID=UPI003569E3F8